MNASHWLMLATGLLLGAAIPHLFRFSSMPFITAGLVVVLGLLTWGRLAARR